MSVLLISCGGSSSNTNNTLNEDEFGSTVHCMSQVDVCLKVSENKLIGEFEVFQNIDANEICSEASRSAGVELEAVGSCPILNSIDYNCRIGDPFKIYEDGSRDPIFMDIIFYVCDPHLKTTS